MRKIAPIRKQKMEMKILEKNTIFDSKKPSKMTTKIYENRCKKQYEKTYRKKPKKITRGGFFTIEPGGEGFTPYIRMGLRGITHPLHKSLEEMCLNDS